VTGCTEVSPGCDHCYAKTFAERWRGLPGHTYEHGFDLTLRPERIDQPRRWTKPRTIFVNSMSDLWHVDVPKEYVLRVFKTMRDTPQHTYQVLTKRAERMERFMRSLAWYSVTEEDRAAGFGGYMPYLMDPLVNEAMPMGRPKPQPHIWLGVSVESPPYYSRIRHLQRTPAAVRFLSCEPLLAPLPDLPLGGIDWCIIGGESGPGARPMQEEWVRDIVRQCRAAGVRPFVKQMGAVWAREHDARGEDGRRDVKGHNMALWPADLRVREMPVRDGRPMEAA
jgi:protein gp37